MAPGWQQPGAHVRLRPQTRSDHDASLDKSRLEGLVRPLARLAKASRLARGLTGGFGKVLAFSLALVMTGTAIAATPVGTVIPNTASFTFQIGSNPVQTLQSNTVQTTVTASKTPSTVKLMRYDATATSSVLVGPTLCSVGGGSYTALPNPVAPDGSTLDATLPQPLADAAVYHQTDPVFIQVKDQDQNLDPTVRDTLVVTLTVADTGDSEKLKLTETGVNTGVFVGYIQTVAPPAHPHDCQLAVKDNSEIKLSYTDPNDPSDVSTDTAPVDPLGIVFDSSTGKHLDGVKVTVIDAATNQPATVYGDDGVSTYPSTVTTGKSAKDSSGASYVFAPGTFRFPLLKSGTYRLQVTAPTGYTGPSSATAQQVQALPGAPYTITAASFEKIFQVKGLTPVQVDIPLDPLGSNLFVQKTASTEQAAVGDFIQFTVTVGNTSNSGAVNDVDILDTLPQGMRYAKGSAKLDGKTVADPAITPDGLQLTFPVGRIAKQDQVTLTYVVEITAATQMGPVTNSAQAFVIGRAASNIGTAQVQITSDLFQDVNTLVGRVMIGDCDAAKPDGMGGVRIFMEDGSYSVTDKDGRFHFQGVKVGTHVVQLDQDSLPKGYEVIDCAKNTRSAGRAYSQFVELHGGALWRVDFHVRKVAAPTGSVSLQLFQMPAGDATTQRNAVDLSVTGVPVTKLNVTVMLPEGLAYVPGTAALNGASVADPDTSSGALVFRLGDAGLDWHGSLTFNTHSQAVASGDLVTRALAGFNTPAANGQHTPVATVELPAPPVTEHVETLRIQGFPSGEAALGKEDEDTIQRLAALVRNGKNIRITVIGHTDDVPLANDAKYVTNTQLSHARAQTVADYLKARLDLSGVKISIVGRGDQDAIASNDTEAGRQQNRRTDIRVDYDVVPIHAGYADANQGKAAPAVAATHGVTEADAPADDTPAAPKPEDFADKFTLDKKWLDGTDGTPQWIWPAEGWLPAIPAIKVAIRHKPDQHVDLYVNGVAVDKVNFYGVTKNATRTVAVSQWAGVPVQEGDNVLRADIKEGDEVVQRFEKKVHYSGVPVRAEVVEDKSILIADGKTKPVIAIKLYDRWGYPARAGTVGRYSLQGQYTAYQSVQDLQQQQLLAMAPREPSFMVGADGTALLVLTPTNQTGQVTLDVPLQDDRFQELHAWLKPGDRDWILVGVANGTAAFDKIKGHMQTSSGDDPNNDVYQDGRVAFYAKGTIKGAFLVTASYDSAKTGGVPGNGLNQTVDPNAYFMLYGDAAEQGLDAVSASKLYVRIERNQFYAMFGDYDTGLTVTELSRYSRMFNGVKSEYNGENVAYSAFAARNAQSFVKDEIQGDGTSGLYHLSHQMILLDSEQITIQVRDRFHSEQVLSTQQLTRYIDYNIDYFAGTIFFKQPVPTRDSSFNPVYIVAQYEVDHGGDQQVTAGGRVAAKFAGDKVEIGATMINEGAGAAGDNKLGGADLRVTLTPGTEFRAEVARTDSAATNSGAGLTTGPGGVLISNTTTQSGTGSAYLAELKTQSAKLESDVYVRQEDTGFGLGQQNLSETGMRKLGADGRYHLTDTWSLTGEAYKETSLADGTGSNSVADAGFEWRTQSDSASFGVRHASGSYGASTLTDSGQTLGTISAPPVGTGTAPQPGDFTSNQLYMGGSVGVLDNNLTLHGDTDVSMGGQSNNPQYPAATTVGADYKVTNTSTLFVDQQFADGSQDYTKMTTLGVRSSPWSQGQVMTSVSSQATEYGPRNFSTMGLTQGWQATSSLALSAGFDRVSSMTQPQQPVLNPDTAPAYGTQSEDFTSMFLGGTYHKESWSWSARAEALHSDSEKRRSLFSGFYKDLSGGDAFSMSLQVFDSSFDVGGADKSADGRIGFAHRPDDSRWTILNQMDLVYDDASGSVLSLINPQESLNQQQTSVSGQDSPGVTTTTAGDQKTWKIINNFQTNYKYSEHSQLSLYYGSKYALFNFDTTGYKGYTDIIGVEYRYDIRQNWDIGFLANRLHSWNSNVVARSFGLETGFDIATNMWLSVGYNFTGFYDQDFTATHYTAKGLFLRFRFKFDQDTLRDLASHGTSLTPKLP